MQRIKLVFSGVLKLMVVCLMLLSFVQDNSIIPDDYPVTNLMLRNNCKEKCIDVIYSFDKAWFKNKVLKEVLVFHVYTDNFRMAIFHCKFDFFHPDFIKAIELRKDKGMNKYDVVDEKTKAKYIPRFYGAALEIDKSYFRTKQNIFLGITKSNALKRFGNPVNDKITQGLEILEWHFQGDMSLAKTGQKLSGKIAKHSFGYHVKMYFKTDHLVALIIRNDVP
jgi:hypothetical protein